MSGENFKKCFFPQSNAKKFNRKVSYDVTHLARKKWVTKSCNLCRKNIGQIQTFGVILKPKEKLIKNWNVLLQVCYWETNQFNKKRFG